MKFASTILAFSDLSLCTIMILGQPVLIAELSATSWASEWNVIAARHCVKVPPSVFLGCIWVPKVAATVVAFTGWKRSICQLDVDLPQTEN